MVGTAESIGGGGRRVKRRGFHTSGSQTLGGLIYNFRTGYYGHRDYHAFYPTWGDQTDIWDGDELFLQFRVKIDPRRLDPGNEGAGKLWFLHMMGMGGANPRQRFPLVDYVTRATKSLRFF